MYVKSSLFSGTRKRQAIDKLPLRCTTQLDTLSYLTESLLHPTCHTWPGFLQLQLHSPAYAFLLYCSVENAKRFRQNNGVLKCGTSKCVPIDYQNLEARRTFQL